MRTILGIIALVLGIGAITMQPMEAQGACNVRRVAVVQEAAVVTPIAVATFNVPAYGAGYSSDAASIAELRALRREVAELRKLLAPPGETGRKERVPAPKEAASDADHVRLLQAKCAACHSDKAEKGKGFSLFQGGKLRALAAEDVVKIQRETMSERMPKNSKPLTDEEFTKLLAGLLNSQVTMKKQ